MTSAFNLNEHAINKESAINEEYAFGGLDCAGWGRLTPVQRDVLRRLYGIGRLRQSVAEAARELGVRQYAVRETATKALRRIEAARLLLGGEG